jgi:hypothetical protein
VKARFGPLLLLLVSGLNGQRTPEWKDGDVLFQTSRSAQSLAIQQATHSRWSHMGILFQKDGRWAVLEAVQPVKYTPAETWIRRGQGGHVVAKRVARLTPADAAKIRKVGETFLGRAYDLTFEWSDQRIYCSELVWKTYERALGIKLGRLQHLQDFDLSSPVVRKKMKERFPGGVPLDESVISPQAAFESPELIDAWSR